MMNEPAMTQSDARMNRIREYAKPIFGYALNRTKSLPDAEDLAQEIMLQLLRSLQAKPDIRNPDAYVWSIAKYVWAHWANGLLIGLICGTNPARRELNTARRKWPSQWVGILRWHDG